MRRSYSFFSRMFAALLSLIVLVISVVAVLSSRMFLRYAQEQIGALSVQNVREVATKLDMLSDSLAWNGMHVTLLLNEATKNGTVPRSGYSDAAASILFQRSMYTTLAAIAEANTSFASVYLYLENTGQVITSDATFDSADAFHDGDWLAAYQAQEGGTAFWMPSRMVSVSTNTSSFTLERAQRVLTYVYPVSSYLAPQTTRGLLVFNVLETAISSLLNNTGADTPQRTLLISGGGVSISDSDPQSIGLSIADKAGIAQVLQSTAKSGYHIDRLDGEPTMLTYSDVGIHEGWRIVRFAPLKTLYAQANDSMQLLLVATATLGVAAMAAVWVISRHFARPLRQMKETIIKSERFASASPDETQLINQTLDYLIREEARLSGELEQRRQARRSAVLQALFVQNSPGAAGWDDPVITLLESSSSIALFLSDDVQSTLPDEGVQVRGEYQSLLARLCEETIRQEGMTFSSLPIYRKDLLVVVHMAHAPDEPARQRLLQSLRQFAETAYRTLHISTTIGVSEVFTGAANAHAAMEQARSAARYKLIVGHRKVIDYARVPRSAGRYFYPSQQEKQVFLAIAAGKKEAAVAAIHQLFETLRTRRSLSTENAMLIVQLFTATLVRQINESQPSQLPIPEGIQILDQVYFSFLETLDEIEAFLAAQVASMFDRAMTPAGEETLFERMRLFIHERYTTDIGIEDIACHLGISYSYTRRVFTENTGRNIVDYINEMRIQSAKAHLAGSTHTISEIAHLVGYNNEQSFTRYFKKYTQMLPSQYRKEQMRT